MQNIEDRQKFWVGTHVEICLGKMTIKEADVCLVEVSNGENPVNLQKGQLLEQCLIVLTQMLGFWGSSPTPCSPWIMVLRIGLNYLWSVLSQVWVSALYLMLRS